MSIPLEQVLANALGATLEKLGYTTGANFPAEELEKFRQTVEVAGRLEVDGSLSIRMKRRAIILPARGNGNLTGGRK